MVFPAVLRANHMFPLMNPDAADRMSRQVKDSFPASQFAYSREDSDKYRLIHSEPGLTLNNDRPPHYTPEEMEIWRKTGNPIGTLFSEDGVELWMDWQHDKAPQTKAIKKLMYESRVLKPIDGLVEEPVTRLPPHLERIVPYLGR